MSTPVLWHITFSNYNEKARWALDYKRIRYRLREAPPGLHPLWAWRLGGGRTFPLLQLDGEPIGDSTRIIAELERRHPTRRSIRPIPASAPGRWSWRTSSTSVPVTRCGASRSTTPAVIPTSRWPL